MSPAAARMAWGAAPARVRGWVEDALGGPVVDAVDQVGGMSPGPAARVRTSAGRRAFVKAVGPELHPDTPELFRREVAVLRVLGPDPRWATLLDALDEGPDGWVVLVLEDVEGRQPVAADDAEAALTAAAVEDLAAELGRRPLPDAATLDARGARGVGLVDLPRRLRMWADACLEVDLPGVRVPDLVVTAASGVRERLLALAEQPTTHLVHWDVRADNVLVRPTGEVVFVDWGQAGAGTGWMDPLLARMDRAEDAWFDDSVRSTASPALAALPEEDVTAFLTGLGVLLAVRAVTHADVGPPGLQAFRLAESERLLRGSVRRLA